MLKSMRTMKAKIQLAISLTCAIIVLVTVTTLLLVQYSDARRELVQQLHTLARTAADGLAAPVAFDAPDEARETLRTLRSIPDLRCVAIARPDGTVFLHQSFGQHDPTMFPARAPANGRLWQRDQVLVAADIGLDERSHGTLWIACGLESFRTSVRRIIVMGAYLYVLATVVAFLAAWLLQRAITRPILELAATADRITREGPSSIRAEKRTDDETGLLVDSFNHMLDHIADQSRRLEDRERCYRTLFAQAAGAVFLESRDRRVLEANHAAGVLLGCSAEALVGRPTAALVAVPGADLPSPAVGERIHVSPAELSPPAGAPIQIDLTVAGIEDAGQPLYLTTAVDISDRLRAQAFLERSRDELKRQVAAATAELRQANADLQHEMDERRRLERQVTMSEKVKSLGLMAGGIAHDFNNLLQAILGNLDLALCDLGDGTDSDTRNCILEAKRAARTAATLATQMLAYAGKGALRVAPVDVNSLIRDAIPVLEAGIGRDVRAVYELADGLPTVPADEDQIRQVLIHLVGNAAEAMAPGGGTFVVRTGLRECDAEFLRRAVLPEDLPPGPYVALSVQDHGSGIAPDILARIFDPFFTTKFIGRGLGLAAVLGIVRAHRAAITLATEPGRGSTFAVYLPVAEISAGNPATNPPPP